MEQAKTQEKLDYDNSGPRTIDRALDDCKEKVIKYSGNSSKALLLVLFAITVLGGVQLYIHITTPVTEKFDSSVLLISYGVFILVFGVTTSFYRFFLKEAAKYEHFLFGLHRIRIAANNSKTGFEDEVRTALTQNAFLEYSSNDSIFSKRKGTVESPIPGYPTSDLSVFLLNSIREELMSKNKEKKHE